MDLTSHLLIAMPGMDDPNFSKTINLICAHSSEGAMGLVLNRPTTFSVKDLFGLESVSNTADVSLNKTVHQGGPVATDQGFILYGDDIHRDDALRIGENYSVTSSATIIDSVINGHGPNDYMVLHGYCGWDANQLEQEINNNIWLTIEADPDLVFGTPADLQWQAAADQLGIGIDFNLVSAECGNA